MRKITREIFKTWKARKAKQIDNTRTDGYTVWLHGHPIVKCIDQNNLIDNHVNPIFELSVCGWPTRTTMERLKPFLPAAKYDIASIRRSQETRDALKDGRPVRVMQAEMEGV